MTEEQIKHRWKPSLNPQNGEEAQAERERDELREQNAKLRDIAEMLEIRGRIEKEYKVSIPPWKVGDVITYRLIGQPSPHQGVVAGVVGEYVKLGNGNEIHIDRIVKEEAK